MTYDSFGEPLTKTVTDGATNLYSVGYTCDNLGRIMQKVETINGVTTTWVYGYDGDGRLDAVTENGNPLASYGYDQNGNRVSVNAAMVTTYDNQDRLLTYGSNSYTYNANGELLTKTTTNGTTSYTWDALGNLTGVKLPSGTDITYLYDGQNRLVGKEVNGTLKQGFLYDGQIEPIAELDGSGNVVEQFVYGTRPNVPDYIIKGGVEYRVIADQVGSPMLIVNVSTGAIAEQISYDAWGNVTSDSNPGFQPFGFAGGLHDSDSGLVHFGARDYDPQTGRWISKDPVLFAGGDPNLYGYSLADPVNNMDSSGTQSYGFPMPYGAPTDVAGYAEAQLAQSSAPQTQLWGVQKIVSQVACVLQQFGENFNSDATVAQQELGPVETIESVDKLAHKAGEAGAEFLGDVSLDRAAVFAAGKGSTRAVAGIMAFKLGSKALGFGSFVAGAALDFGDAISAGIDTARYPNQCCPE